MNRQNCIHSAKFSFAQSLLASYRNLSSSFQEVPGGFLEEASSVGVVHWSAPTRHLPLPSSSPAPASSAGQGCWLLPAPDNVYQAPRGHWAPLLLADHLLVTSNSQGRVMIPTRSSLPWTLQSLSWANCLPPAPPPPIHMLQS